MCMCVCGVPAGRPRWREGQTDGGREGEKNPREIKERSDEGRARQSTSASPQSHFCAETVPDDCHSERMRLRRRKPSPRSAEGSE